MQRAHGSRQKACQKRPTTPLESLDLLNLVDRDSFLATKTVDLSTATVPQENETLEKSNETFEGSTETLEPSSQTPVGSNETHLESR